MFEARMVADSVGPTEVRISTMEVVTWKPVVAEFNTHRMLTRNSKSSRAVPWVIVERQLRETPYVPRFRRNKTGMVPGDHIHPLEQLEAEQLWLEARDQMLEKVALMGAADGLNIHKQWLNRLLEPWMETTILVTATEWENFFNLRCHPAAQDEIRLTAEAMRQCLDSSVPRVLEPGEWHLPYVNLRAAREITHFLQRELKDSPSDSQFAHTCCLVSAGRCATVSYDNLGEGIDVEKDYKRANKLLSAGHMSPFEHQALCLDEGSFGQNKLEYSGNFRAWHQFRKLLPNEAVFQG